MKKILIYFGLLLSVVFAHAQVQQVEYFFDADPGYGNGINAGTATVLSNNSDRFYETLTFEASLSNLADGFHTLFVRAKNGKGWSQTMTRPFVKGVLPEELSHEIAYLEYFIDTDPGYGRGTAVDSVENAGSYYLDASIENLPDGFHTLFVRAKNRYGRWSQLMCRHFVKTILAPSDYVCFEYFIDTDPGREKGKKVSFTNGAMEIDFTAALENITLGNHLLSIRGKNKNHEWFAMGTHAFTVLEDSTIGINQQAAVENIVVYPNPVTDLLFIKNTSSQIDHIELVDIKGSVLTTVLGGNNSILQLSLIGKPSGTYFLKVYFRQQMKVMKIIKQ